MLKINTDFFSEEEKKRFVEKCENSYKNRITDVANDISAKRPKFVLLSGPSCSGKTTTSLIFSGVLAANGINAKIISIDDFYLDRSYTMGNNIDIESVDAIDTAYFDECVSAISKKSMARIPRFDFPTGTRAGYEDYTPSENDIVVFEGIQALYPEIKAIIGKFVSEREVLSIFLGYFDDVEMCDDVFGARDLRFCRRLLRDCRDRGANLDIVLSLWQAVTANEDKNIIPYANTANYFINTFLEYEPFVMRNYLLKAAGKDTTRVNFADALISKFLPLPEISSDYVPKDSMFREFIGKQ
ncbi:MAG: hypothetical protein KBS59_02790 [Clostridiales bacterium]|nr:hypothetical protein [Clostridiales bacterium]